jgi:hypothetical protein
LSVASASATGKPQAESAARLKALSASSRNSAGAVSFRGLGSLLASVMPHFCHAQGASGKSGISQKPRKFNQM